EMGCATDDAGGGRGAEADRTRPATLERGDVELHGREIEQPQLIRGGGAERCDRLHPRAARRAAVGAPRLPAVGAHEPVQAGMVLHSPKQAAEPLPRPRAPAAAPAPSTRPPPAARPAQPGPPRPAPEPRPR